MKPKSQCYTRTTWNWDCENPGRSYKMEYAYRVKASSIGVEEISQLIGIDNHGIKPSTIAIIRALKMGLLDTCRLVYFGLCRKVTNPDRAPYQLYQLSGNRVLNT